MPDLTKLPGMHSDKETIERMVRVNHAGEYGATYIYKGQCAVLGQTDIRDELRHMLEQEEEHLALFSQELNQRQIRPSALSPLWKAGGYAVGALTALMGKEAAMACTVAVEDAIMDHYQAQADQLKEIKGEEALHDLVVKCRDEELEHRDAGLNHGAESAPGYSLLYKAIHTLSRGAIQVAKRI